MFWAFVIRLRSTLERPPRTLDTQRTATIGVISTASVFTREEKNATVSRRSASSCVESRFCFLAGTLILTAVRDERSQPLILSSPQHSIRQSMFTMATINLRDINTKVEKSLEGTAYASSHIRKLVGGSVNYVYHAKLVVPLSDGTTEVLVKHGEAHMARKPEFPLPMIRTVCVVESTPAGVSLSICGRKSNISALKVKFISQHRRQQTRQTNTTSMFGRRSFSMWTRAMETRSWNISQQASI